VDVIGARQLRRATKCVADAAALNEGGRHAHADPGEPTESKQIDARKDPQARDADRQKSDVADGERRREVTTSGCRPHMPERTGVRDREQQRPEHDHDDHASRVAEFRRGDADESRADAECKRRPEPRRVELQRFGNELPDRPCLRR
jgi:hypothetical protein